MTAPGHVFVVEGAASSQLPLRLLGFFAQQDLLPATICMTRSTSGLAMRIVEATLDEHRAGVILAKMQALPDVASALLTHSQGASCLIGGDG
ncbi:hypothetical protein [Polymorphobacter megasporae]|uniref:hypothetical protein n=1 Tax=Glacieibacterium megasporae TaxID=2835787 RepID=UPI001C1DD041|nr:hypothetical protein [Polymorphobacter megasporae]UAJ11042.1 hypothetical protein KTC28_04830 [Polymorphobacter megasporae]